MQAINIVGFKNSGKTALMLALADALEKEGLSVAIAKQSHAPLDAPDTDTGRLRKPHSKRQLLALGQGEAALFWGEEKKLGDLLPFIKADILLVEGAKEQNFLPRIICLRPEDDIQALSADLLPHLALATYSFQARQDSGSIYQKPYFPDLTQDSLTKLVKIIKAHAFALPRLQCGSCGFANCEELATAIVAGEKTPKDCPVLQGNITLQVNGRPIALNPFTARIIAGAMQGMVGELKGVDKETDKKPVLTFSCTL